MNYLFLSIIIAVLLLAELIIIAPTLIKRTARLKKDATGGDIVLSRRTKVCLLVEMALRGLLIILQIVLAVMSKEYSLEAALLLFGVGQILGHGIGVVITLTSVCLLFITWKKERETRAGDEGVIRCNVRYKYMPLKEYIERHLITRIGFTPPGYIATEVIVDDPESLIDAVIEHKCYISSVLWWDNVRVGIGSPIGYGGPGDPRSEEFFFSETLICREFESNTTKNEYKAYLDEVWKMHRERNLYPAFDIKPC